MQAKKVMAKKSNAVRGLLGAAAVLLLGYSPLGAEWLVLRDGSKVEVRSGWRVDGKRIVFEMADGTLSSLKLDQVDLDASARATSAPDVPKTSKSAPAATPAPKSRRVFTDADFSHPPPIDPATVAEGGAGSEGANGEAQDGKGAQKPPQPLEVLVWNQNIDPATGQILITGTLRNSGADLASSVSVEVQLVDRDGVVLTKSSATVASPNVRPGAEVEFRVRFPSTPGFETAKFDIKSVLFKAAPKTETAPKT